VGSGGDDPPPPLLVGEDTADAGQTVHDPFPVFRGGAHGVVSQTGGQLGGYHQSCRGLVRRRGGEVHAQAKDGGIGARFDDGGVIASFGGLETV
jgi:hypothetical protein